MSKKHSLSLYENAIDSLNMGIKLYKDSMNNTSMYKFCIIIITNFAELILKRMVELQNPILCFKKQYSTPMHKEMTIGWRDALEILLNFNIDIDYRLKILMEKLYEVRNEIIHYKFEYETNMIRNVIILTIYILRKLYKNVTKHDFIDDVTDDTRKILEILNDENNQEIHFAQENAKEEADEKEIDVDNCNICGKSETAVKRDDDEIYCHFCEETDYETKCFVCKESYKISEMEYHGESEYGDMLYICNRCR